VPFYHTLGRIPRKRHIAFRKPDGGLYNEHLMGNEGFTGPSSLLYHIYPPTTVKSVKRLREWKYEGEPHRMLKHRHFRTAQIERGGSPTLDRKLVMYNDDIAMFYAVPALQDEHFFRNAQGDEVVYVAEGEGNLETQFGDLPIAEGDYLVIHRGLMHRYQFTKPARLLIFESRGYVRPPSRYLNYYGQVVEGAPYSERDFKVPRELKTFDQRGDFPLIVKQFNGLQEFILDHHPLDVVGWDGMFYPWAFNIHDFEPIVGKVHQPPPVHQTFQGDGFVICSFCPRPYDFHPQAVPAPYNHSNVDSDEMLFYASSEFMSRKGIEYGSITLHPDGIPHGPHPGRAEASIGAKATNELAVMMDSFRPMKIAREFLAYEDEKYQYSWLEGGEGFSPPTS
jgi:homogentisate 1,2-dioxygenase